MTAVQKRRASDLDPACRARELVRLRTLLGASAAGWAGEAATTVEDDRWLVRTDTASVDLNIALCHGESARTKLQSTVEDILRTGNPSILMVAGDALAGVQKLAESHWVCVGSAPFMVCELGITAADPDVRQLSAADLGVARAHVAERFELPAGSAHIAIPDQLGAGDPRCAAWGLIDSNELVSCVVSVIVDDVAVIWWLATPASRHRRGFGRRLLLGVLHEAALVGARKCVLYSSPVGTPFYESMGFDVLEVWQTWSRPRWVLGRD